MIVTAGSSNVSVYFYIVQDASATSPGEPVTGLLFSDIETGGSASYVRQGAVRTDLTLITLSGASAAHADGGFILVDDTNMPGLYRCDYPDAAFATAVDQVMLQIVVASGKNAVASPIFVEITDVDLRDSVRGGMTALPNAAADAGGGLPISDAGGLDMDLIKTDTAAILTDTADMQPRVVTIETDTTTDIPALIATAQADLDIITGAAGALLDSTATSAQLVDDIWDEVLTGATHNVATSSGRRLRGIQDFGNYLGAINIDTINGTAGTVVDENGTVDNPVDNLADALTLNTTKMFDEFRLRSGSSITLVSNSDGFVFCGVGWTIALGGQSISGSVIEGANVSGTGTGAARPTFIKCFLNTMTIVPFHALSCGLEDATITFSAAGDYTLANCHSDVPGMNTPIIDTGAAVANVNLTMPHYDQGVEIRNLNNNGTDLFSISGQGQIVYAASSSGTVHQRGNWKVTNTGGVTITADDNTTNISATLTDTAEIGAAGGGLTDLGGMSTAMKAEILAEVVKLLTTQMTESYAADGTAPTLAQALMLIQQSMHEFAIAATTRTVKKLDGSATAATFTLDDAVNPTSTTRAT